MGVLAEGLNLTASEGPTVPLEWQRDYLVEHHERLLQHWVTKIYFPVAITASVTGTFGNLLIITSILYAKELKNVGNMFILNLAVTDLVVTVFINTWNILGVALGKEWFLDRWWVCDGIQIICGCACVGALLNIALVAVNRYIHICRSDLYHKIYTPFNTGIMCIGAWVGGFLLMELPNILGPGGHMFDLKSYNCTIDRLRTYWWTITRILVIFGTPMFVTGFCYFKIFSHVQSSKKRINAMGGEKKPDADKEAKARRDSQKLALTLFSVFAVYVMAYTPYAILVIFDPNDRVPMPYYFLAYLLVHLSFAINWLLYGVTNKQFRRVYFRVLRIEKCCPGMHAFVETTAGSSTSGTASSTAGEKSVIASHA